MENKEYTLVVKTDNSLEAVIKVLNEIGVFVTGQYEGNATGYYGTMETEVFEYLSSGLTSEGVMLVDKAKNIFVKLTSKDIEEVGLMVGDNDLLCEQLNQVIVNSVKDYFEDKLSQLRQLSCYKDISCYNIILDSDNCYTINVSATTSNDLLEEPNIIAVVTKAKNKDTIIDYRDIKATNDPYAQYVIEGLKSAIFSDVEIVAKKNTDQEELEKVCEKELNKWLKV